MINEHRRPAAHPFRDGRLVFLHSSSSNKFWRSLLEKAKAKAKAYAKLAACYANLDGGRFEDAMVDFTDGLAQDFELPAIRNDPAAARRLETIMLDAFNRDSIMCTGIDVYVLHLILLLSWLLNYCSRF